MTTAAATLHLKIDTGTAAADLLTLKNEYSSLKAALGTDLKAGGFSGLSDELKKARSDIAQLTAAAATSAKAYEVLENKLKDIGNQSKTTAEGMVAIGAAISGATVKSKESLDEMGAKFKSTTDAIMAEKKRLAQSGVDFGSELKGQKLIAQSTTDNIVGLRKYISTLQEAKKLLATTEAPELLKKQYGSTVIDEIAKINQYEKALEALVAAKVVAASTNSTSPANTKAELDAMAAVKAHTKALEEHAAANALAAKAANERNTANLIQSRADAIRSREEHVKSNTAAALAAHERNSANLIQGRGANTPQSSYNSLMNSVSTTTPVTPVTTANPVVSAKAIKDAADHQAHWNKVANEGHAAARGLSGALGGLWMTYGSIAPLLAGAAVASSLKAVFSVGKALEYEFAVVSAISDGATVNMQKFNAAVEGTMFTPMEAAKGYRVLAQAGLDTVQAMQALPSVLKLATVGETDMANAALSATSIMHTFGLEVGDMGHIGDVFSKAAAISATSVKEMMEAMKQASSVANVYGVSLEETGAALATLANRGIEGSAAGTAVRNMVKELSAPATDKAANAMKQFGIQIFDADGKVKPFMDNLEQLRKVTTRMSDQTKTRFLEDLFNERGVKAANILLTDVKKMKSALDDLQKSSMGLGFMTEAQMKIAQSTDGMLKGVVSSAQLMFADVFRVIEPQIKDIVIALADIVKSGGLKDFMESLATSVANATKFLVQHGEAVKNVVLAYAGFKATGLVVSGVLAISGAMRAATVAAAALGVAQTAAMAASIGPGLASVPVLSRVGAGLAAVAATATTGGGALAALASTTIMLGAALPIIGIAALAAGLVYLAATSDKLSADMRKSVDEAKGMVDASTRLNAATQSSIEKLLEENKVIEDQITTMRSGIRAADDFGRAKMNMAQREAKETLTGLQEQRAIAAAGLPEATRPGKPATTGERGIAQMLGLEVPPERKATGSSTYESSRLSAQQIAQKTEQVRLLDIQIAKQQGNVDDSNREAVVADLAGQQKRANETIAAKERRINGLNEKIAERIATAERSAATLKEGKFYGSTEAQEAVKKTLESDVKAGEAAKKIARLKKGASEEQLKAAEYDLGLDNLQYTKLGRPGKPPKEPSEPKLPKDWKTGEERSALELLKEMQKEEIDVLQSSHKYKLISEEQFESDSEAIYARHYPNIVKEYSESLDRLEAIADKGNGAEAERAQTQYNVLKKDFIKYLADRRMTLLDANNKELGMQLAAKAKADEAIAKAQASSQEVMDRMKDARLKLDMNPESAAAYDAGNKSDALFKDAETSQSAAISEKLRRGLTLENEELRVQIGLMNDLQAAKAAARAESEKAAKAETAHSRSFETGWKQAYNTYQYDAENSAKIASDAFNTGTRMMEDAIVQFATTGKLAYKDMTKSILKYIAEIAAKQAAAGLAKMVLGAVGSLAGAAWGSMNGTGGVPAQQMPAPVVTAVPSALGNVFTSPSLSAFSGGVYDTPQTFAFAQGAGIFAEAGPEAIMPLSRDSGGRLGVKAIVEHSDSGSESSSGVTVLVNVNIDNNGGSKQDTKSSSSGDDTGKRLGEMVGGVVRKVLVEEMRSGGMLERVRA